MAILDVAGDEIWFDKKSLVEEKRLRTLINNARTHPENWPPNGNSSGALMAACPSPFRISPKLCLIARDHSQYLRSQSKEWVQAGDNKHRGPSGKLVGEEGEPMHQAGFLAWRAENVAFGFHGVPEARDVVRLWMQDD